MSAADVEIVREMYLAYNRGDYETSIAMLHEDAELHQPDDLPDADRFFGRDEFVRGLSAWHAAFEPGFQYVIEELTAGEGCVFIRLVLRGRGRESGIEVDMESFNIWEVRDGHPFRCRIFSTEDRARAAAGLPTAA